MSDRRGFYSSRTRTVPPPPGWILLFETYVAGVDYYDFSKGDLPLDEGMMVNLVREPSNQFDGNAIEVFTPQGEKLGYLPRRENGMLARLMDGGWVLEGRLEQVFTGRPDMGKAHPYNRRPFIELSVFAPAKLGSNG